MSRNNGVLDNGFLGNGDAAWLKGGPPLDDAAKTAVHNRAFTMPPTSPPPSAIPPASSIPEGSPPLAGGRRPPDVAARTANDPEGVAAAADAAQDEKPGYKHDEAGRFAKGTIGGPGNPYNRQVAHLKRVLLETVTDEDIAAIGKMLIQQAKDGNVAAARVLFMYVLPKGPDPDRLDKHEWDTAVEAKDIKAGVAQMAMTPLPEPLLASMRVTREIITDELIDGMCAGLRATPEQMAKLREKDPEEFGATLKKWGGMDEAEWQQYLAAEEEKKAKRRKRRENHK